MDSGIELSQASFSSHPPTTSAEQLDEGNRNSEEAAISLPPADGGKDAWLFLVAGFAVEALIWGLPFAFGLFESYLIEHSPFSDDASDVPIIGTSATGIMYMSCIVLMPAFSVWPRIRRISAFTGVPVMIVGLITASFANTVWQLILTQGVLYAIGGSLTYCPTILFIDEWFVRRKGLAFGLMLAGTGVSGTITPFIVNWGLESYGFRTVMRIWALSTTVILTPLLYFVKPRLPIPATRQARPLDLRFLASPTFWILELSNVFQSLGYFLPSIYLPTIAQSYGSSTLGATLTLVCQNLAAVFGGMAVGMLVDRFHVTSVMMMLATFSTSAVFILWGFSQSLPLLILFSICYGLTAGSFSTCWPGVIKEVQSGHAGADTGMIFGLLGAGRGIGAIASGPLSAALIKPSAGLHEAAYGFMTGYGPMITFTGLTATAGSFGFFARRLGWL